MAKTTFKSLYIVAILVGIFVTVATEDKPIGLLLTIALVLGVAELQKRRPGR